MADDRPENKVVPDQKQAQLEKLFAQKADRIQQLKSKQFSLLKRRNNLVGLLLAGGVLGIYGYTLYAVRQGKLMDAFDKTPE